MFLAFLKRGSRASRADFRRSENPEKISSARKDLKRWKVSSKNLLFLLPTFRPHPVAAADSSSSSSFPLLAPLTCDRFDETRQTPISCVLFPQAEEEEEAAAFI